MSSIIKFKGDRCYAKISNKLLQNNKLSLKARGLMAYILSLPDSWEIHVEHLHNEASEHDGRTAVQGAMAELRALGYLHLEPKRADGKICGSHWVAFDDPSENVAAPFNISDKQVSRQAENLSAGKPTAIKEIEDIKELEEIKETFFPPMAGKEVEVAKPKRPRNPVLEALASVEYRDLSQVTNWPRIAKALAIIKGVSPEVTAQEIRSRSVSYVAVMPKDSTITAMALANNWGKCTPQRSQIRIGL